MVMPGIFNATAAESYLNDIQTLLCVMDIRLERVQLRL